MRFKPRKGSWILALAFVIAWVTPITARVQAAVEPGLSATVYNNYGYNNAPPLPTVSGRPVQCTTTYLSIDQDFGNNICGLYDDFIVKYEGYITSPTTETYTLYMHGDDGVKLYLDDVLTVDAWYDSGNAGATTEVSFVAGVPQNLLAWYYENGGGNWVKLDYLVNGSWVPVPDSWFTQTNEPTNTTTTTLSPYLNEVTNLTAVANENGSVDLDWDAPTSSNVDIYAYGVTFYDLDEIGGTTSGGWGVWTNQGTSYSLADYMFSGSNPVTTGFGPVRFGIKAGNQSCFSNEGVGPCVYGPETTVDETVIDPTPATTTTTTSTTTTTTTEPELPVIPEPEVPVIPEPEVPVTPEPETTTTTTTEPATTTTTEPEAIEIPTVTTTTEVETVETTVPEEEVVAVEPPKDPDPTPEVVVPEDTQDAADAAVEDIFDGPMSDGKLADAVDGLIADAETPEEMTAVVDSLLDQELTDTQFATVIDSVFSEPLSDENFTAAVDAVFEDPTKLSDEQFEDAVVAVFDGPLSDTQFEDAVTAVFEDTKALSDEQFDAAVQAVFEEPLTTEQFSDALEAVFDEPITDEKFDAIIDAVLDEPLSDEQFEELVGVLESDTVTEDQVAAAVDSVIENGVTEDQATDLATSEKVLESIDTDQAAEIFDAIPVGDLSAAEEAALVAAVSDAPDEIKDEFETEIDVYGEGLNDYVPTGSQVDVGSRRTLLAATAALSAATVGMGPGTGSSGPSGGSGGSGGGSGGSGGGPGDGSNTNGRKEDEDPDGEEEDTEIEGPEDQEENHFTRNSIFKYEEETMKRRFSPWGFIKKFSRETSALAFTISGSVVVFATLSGETRKITVIATGCAFAVHYFHAMIKNDED